MGNMFDNGRMLCKQEIIKGLEEMQSKARGNRRLFLIKMDKERKPFGPIFSTAPKDLVYKNKINLGNFNISFIDGSELSSTVNIYLGKGKCHPEQKIYYSFDGGYFERGEKDSPRSVKEVYGLLENIAESKGNSLGFINEIVFDMEKLFEKRFNEALEFEKKYKYRKR